MTPPLTRTELVTIGDELMLGFTIDTNGAFLARRLAELGVTVTRRTAVGDDVDAIADCVREALDRTGAVITTGGLGPTSDDVTRDAVARVFGRRLRMDDAHLAWMTERWRARFGSDLPESNKRQAMLPDGAETLVNRHGSAPGAWLTDDRGRWAILLPGVPRELRGMTDDALVPLLERLGAGGGACVTSLTLRTTGIPESLLQDRLANAGASRRGDAPAGIAPSLAYLPGVEGVDLRLTVHDCDVRTAVEVLRREEAVIRAVLAADVYGTDETDLAAIVLDRCRARGLRIAVAESCTGGLLGARLTAIPGSSDVFVGGVIAYADAVKTTHLGVPADLLARHGAVSEDVVREMAVAAQRRFDADVGLAVTGIAGPGGGTPSKPVGLVWICAAIGDRVEPRRLTGWGNRDEIRFRATQSVLDLARRHVSA